MIAPNINPIHITQNAPAHYVSLASPDKSWAKGNLTILTDEAVENWLVKHHPDAARTIKRESRIVFEQQQAELPLSRPGKDESTLTTDALPCTPIAELAAGPKHWAAALYPGHGSFEICQLVAPLLTAKEAAALRLQFAEGRSGRDMAAALGVSHCQVYSLLKSARVKLYRATKDGALPTAYEPAGNEPADNLGEIERLLREWPTVYQRLSHSRPKRRAWVCDCGHHLTLTPADLDHRRVDPRAAKAGSKAIPERLFRCPHCGKTYTESDWPKIRA